MKIKCEFTIELNTQEDFSKVINYMKETDVLDDYLNDEGVVLVPRRVLLRLVERVEVPKRGLDALVGLHLLEAHLEEDATEHGAHLPRPK